MEPALIALTGKPLYETMAGVERQPANVTQTVTSKAKVYRMMILQSWQSALCRQSTTTRQSGSVLWHFYFVLRHAVRRPSATLNKLAPLLARPHQLKLERWLQATNEVPEQNSLASKPNMNVR